jgi:biotin synthase
MSVDLSTLVEKSLRDELLTREEARALLRWPEDNLLELIHAAYRVRRTYFGKTVKLNYLVNIQSGVCAEDCHYCSQSKISDAPVDKYKLLSPEAVVQAAESAVASGAARLCLVASMRGPSDRDVAAVSEAVRQVKAKYPALEICACLGILKDGQAAALAMAGVQAYKIGRASCRERVS